MNHHLQLPVANDDGSDEKEKEKAGDILIGKMLKTRSILLSGEVNKELAERVVRQLLLLEAEGDDPVRVFIDSPGGDVDAGFAIFDMLRFIKPKIYIIGMGLVASAGALILLAADAEDRVGLPNSHYLIHQPLSGMRGVATDIEIHAREIERTRERINRIISGSTGLDIAKVEKDTDRDYWMSAEEAKEYGLISRIVRTRDELEDAPSAPKRRKKKTDTDE
jgi:ATP-dependent Clp protease, protease subunit